MMNRSPEELFKVLEILKSIGIENNVVLIGSWAEMFYEEMLEGYEANIRTMDVDFLYLNVNKPTDKINFTEIMKSHGYGFEEDYVSGKTKYYNTELEIEFLSKKTRDNRQVIEVKGLGVGVECIGGLEIIDHNYTKYESKKYGLTVNLPTPAVYCIHKILINHSRSSIKATKDAEAIKRILPFLIFGKNGKEDFYKIYSSLSKKQLKTFNENAEKLGVLKIITDNKI